MDETQAGDTTVRDWLIASILVVCLVGAPLAIYFWPPTFVPYRDAFFGLALVPGLVLGVMAVWLTVSTRS